MARNAEELRSEIARTREHLGATMEAIGDRVSPARIAERSKNQVVFGARSVKDRIMGTVGDTMHDGVDSVRDLPDTILARSSGQPMVAGGVAFGLGFLAAVAFPATDVERQASATLMEKAEPVKDEMMATAHEMADHLKEPGSHALNEVKNAASEAASEVKDAAVSAGHRTQDAAQGAMNDIRPSSG